MSNGWPDNLSTSILTGVSLRSWNTSDHFRGTFSGVNTDVEALLDLDLLIKQMALAMGLAMVIGNGYAVYKNRKGEKPKGEEGEFRAARAWWLITVGVFIGTWGAVSLLT